VQPIDFLTRYHSYMIAVLRIVTGLMFMEHGTQKLFGFPAPSERGSPELFSLSGIGAVMEFVGGLLVAVGYLPGLWPFCCQARWRWPIGWFMHREAFSRF
jgi:uncharacterized membrane protein YphA (DoxX/SURF4 family)